MDLNLISIMKKYLLISSLLLLLVSCIHKVVPDPIDPRLPMYTETGKNASGAFVNDKVWESLTHTGILGAILDPPSISVDSINNVVMRFQGKLDSEGAYYLDFYLSGLNIHAIKDLFVLNNKVIPLDGETNFAVLSKEYFFLSDIETKVGGNGQLYFKRVYINSQKTEAIVSGTFGFTYTNPEGETYKVTYGRFDFKIYAISKIYYPLP